jgi:tyrosyl-tRNA synthetase
MSKSLGNYIGIADAPDQMFGKLMSISDELMWRYFDLLSFRSLSDIVALKAGIEAGANPRDVKVELATEIVTRFHGAVAAETAHQGFVGRHRHGEIPDDLPEQVLVTAQAMGLPQLLRAAGLVGSASEAIRMVRQGAVRIDGERVDDHAQMIETGGAASVYQVGKRRFARVRVTAEEKT